MYYDHRGRGTPTIVCDTGRELSDLVVLLEFFPLKIKPN